MATARSTASRGSIRQRAGDGWELRVYQGLDPATGRQRYATRTVHGTRRTANRALEALTAEIDGGKVHAGTVGDLLERWYAAASPGWARTTAAHTRSIIDCHLTVHLGPRAVVKLTTADIDDMYGMLLARGGRDGAGLAPGTVRRIHGVLHRALAQALRWEWIWVNPASVASPPRVRRAALRPPDPAQVAALLASVRDEQPLLFCFLRLAATTGARRGQLLALRWRDIDLNHGAIAFTRSLVIGPDGPVLAATKNDRTHQVELDHQTLQVLRDTRTRAELHAASTTASVTLDSFVFSRDADGRRPWLPNYATHQFGAARRAAGLPPFRLHDLRHFMATQMLSAAVPLATVAQRLNHARISTTVNVYTHAIRAWDRPAAEIMSGLLADTVPMLPRRPAIEGIDQSGPWPRGVQAAPRKPLAAVDRG